ncbi:chaperone NapD [Bosea sp. BIWAKO-01]|uniref:chaperone NapD n=1 Tax=Bosea sp. BIWAKO-01 TaxID=506668 RepID=UPI0008531E86|nr:chaperone NapD [Bosea sp. BIWAKO-01]GAU81570.1 periplasmic diheme c-type cytochrome protein NapB [Bosea sp. BIWAKO-01]
MPEARASRTIHISSAVVTAFPEHCDAVVRQINALPGTEVHRVENGKIVIVMEAESTGEMGGRLTGIALMDGVLSANFVFEQITTLDDIGAGS